MKINLIKGWSQIVREAVEFTRFQWQLLANNATQQNIKIHQKYQSSHQKILNECEDLRGENKLLQERSKRILQQIAKRDKYCKKLEQQLAMCKQDNQFNSHQMNICHGQPVPARKSCRRRRKGHYAYRSTLRGKKYQTNFVLLFIQLV